MKLIATLIIASFAMILSKKDKTIVNNNECSSQLIVEKNRSSKSADEDGAQFILVLTNTSKNSKTYNLSSKNLSGSCGNKTQYNRSANSGNHPLEVSFQNNDLNASREKTSSNKGIVLKSGESYKFIVNVTAPKDTPYNTWSCIEIEAKSTDCESVSETEVLSVYVVDPTKG